MQIEVWLCLAWYTCILVRNWILKHSGTLLDKVNEKLPAVEPTTNFYLIHVKVGS